MWQPDLISYNYIETTLGGGFNTSVTPDKIDNTESPDLSNVVFVQDQLRTDMGYTVFGQAVSGIPQKAYNIQFVDSSSLLILITTTTVYYWNTTLQEWLYLAFANTTLSANALAGASSVTLTSTTGFGVGRPINILLNNGTYYFGTVAAGGAGSTINISPNLPSAANSGNAITSGDTLTGSLDNPVSVVFWGAINGIVFCNGVNPVRYFAEGGTITAVPNLPTNTTCQTLGVFNELLLLGNTTENGTNFPYRIRNCDQADFTNWTTGLAAINDLEDTSDPIYSLNPLGTWMIIYRSSTIMRITYLGQPLQTLYIEYMVRTEGLLGFRCVADVGDSHIFLGKSNVYEYLGDYSVNPVGDDIFYSVLAQNGNLNPAYKQRAFALYISYIDEVLFFYPAFSNQVPSITMRYNRADNTWSFRTFNDQMTGYGMYTADNSTTWAGTPGTWQQQIASWNAQIFSQLSPVTLLLGNTGQVYSYGDTTVTTDNNNPIFWYFTTKQFGSEYYKVRGNRLVFNGYGNGILIEYALDQTANWSTLNTLNLGAGSQSIVSIYFQQVYSQIQFRFSGQSTAGIDSMSIEYMPESLW